MTPFWRGLAWLGDEQKQTNYLPTQTPLTFSITLGNQSLLVLLTS